MQKVFCFSLLLLSLFSATNSSSASVSVQDDAKHIIKLATPAKRIISLAPHATELLFEAGARHLIVGVSDYSDYPEAAKKITPIGNIFALDLERLIRLKPDLIVVWGTGNAKLIVDKLRGLKIPVFESEPRSFEMLASSLERLSILTGLDETGVAAANRFRNRLELLRSTYALKPSEKKLSVFYQVWGKPLMTLNNQHLVSSAISLCGGVNIFGDLKDLSPSVTIEAVLAADPQVIITTSGEQQDNLSNWLQFNKLSAVSKANLYTIKGDWLNRAGPRVLDGTEELCKNLKTARTK
ncbi:cobalamin-binding protein [Undibacterium parvum]|uniref:Cobalamin-binding protein n=1 Tax=Undibacterium parvum TaxID=401471 RepID=A0A3S9HQ83_9BURK|nr:cobalamin-binding protein [Undibacterium parvum]AZP14229.1 cobalamin-binding protein [Undibacterium parvum]